MSSKFLVALASLSTLMFCSAYRTCYGQTKNEQTIRIVFVDQAGEAVSPDAAWYFNGGTAKKITANDNRSQINTRGIVVAKAEGFQYSGAIIEGSDKKIIFYADGQPAPAATQTAYPLNEELREQVCEFLREKLWERIEALPSSSQRIRLTLELLATIDAQAVEQWLAKNELSEQDAQAVRSHVLLKKFEANMEDALDQVSQIKNPMLRCVPLFSIMERFPADHPAMPAVEKQAWEVSRTIQSAPFRLAIQAALA